MTLSEKLLQNYIYKPNKIDETIIVYWNLGFRILVLLNKQLVILHRSTTDFNWLFKDKMEIISDKILQTMNFDYLVNSGTYSCLCSDSELKQLIFNSK